MFKIQFEKKNQKIPIIIAASIRKLIPNVSSFTSVINRGTTPCDITEPFCLLLPITAFFKQINAS